MVSFDAFRAVDGTPVYLQIIRYIKRGAAAYALFGLRMYPPSLTGSALVTALRVVFSLGLLVCQLLLAACFGTGSRYGYTIRRLQVSESQVLLWSSVCNALCFACVWCVQVMGAIGAAALHAADARYAEGAQGIFVDLYRSDFLHGLLPLADGYLWVRNGSFVLALGVLTAYMQLGLRQKNGGRRLTLAVLTGLMLLVLPVGFGSGRTAGILQSAAALFAAGICGYLGFLQAHNGKEGPEDEMD